MTLEEVPVGELGEVWLRSYSVMDSLHKQERGRRLHHRQGWYRTGGAGRFDEDGHFYYVGRMGDPVKSSGMNVTPRDVELVLEDQPEVAMAYVCGVGYRTGARTWSPPSPCGQART